LKEEEKFPMLLSIIIVTWNSEAYIQNCLHSLDEEIQGWELEVIVVDNASSDKTVKIIEKEFPQVHLIVNAQNFVFARAVNHGINLSRGERLLLLNPDTIVCPEALKSMVQFMESNLKVGVVGPQLLTPEGKIQPSCREFPSYSTLLFEFLGLSRLFPRDRVWGRWRMGYFNHKTRREVDQPMGACLLIRRKVVEEIGLFDERRSEERRVGKECRSRWSPYH